MVQGISKQIIMLQAKDEDIFEQAIFILKEEAVNKGGVTEDVLLKQARSVIHADTAAVGRFRWRYLACGVLGSLFTCAAWLIAALL